MVGYQDASDPKQGALLLRNSWGTNWGDGGYGWLSYAFVNHHLVSDVWTIIGAGWADSRELLRPRLDALPAMNQAQEVSRSPSGW